jgi:4-amino-4-deoxy-L-arabinose transferase-like glycosyltransferase
MRLNIAEVAPETWILVGLTVVAALLRFGTITSQSFWVDEATTVHEVGLPLGGMLHAISAHESTPPLYFLVAWVWTRLFGAGELGLRSLSAVAGTALVPVTYLCGKELVSRAAGAVAAGLATVSPFLIWYSQEGRSYMLFALLGALSLLFWARCLRSERASDAAAWALCSALALLTHFFAGFLVGPEALWLLWRRRSRQTGLAVSAVAAVQLALVPLIVTDASHPLLSWLRLFPLSTRLEQIPVDFGASQLFKSPAIDWGLPGAAILLAIVVALLVLGGSARERRGAWGAGLLAACVLLVPVALAEAGHDYVFSRNLIVAWVPLAVLIGGACTGPRARVPGTCLVLLLLGGSVWAGVKIDGNPAYQRPDWRAVARALGAPAAQRAIAAYAGNAAGPPLSVYLPNTTFSYSALPRSERAVTVTELDLVGNAGQTPVAHLPRGMRLLSTRLAGGMTVSRLILSPAWREPPATIAVRSIRLVSPSAPEPPAVLIQR